MPRLQNVLSDCDLRKLKRYTPYFLISSCSEFGRTAEAPVGGTHSTPGPLRQKSQKGEELRSARQPVLRPALSRSLLSNPGARGTLPLPSVSYPSLGFFGRCREASSTSGLGTQSQACGHCGRVCPQRNFSRGGGLSSPRVVRLRTPLPLPFRNRVGVGAWFHCKGEKSFFKIEMILKSVYKVKSKILPQVLLPGGKSSYTGHVSFQLQASVNTSLSLSFSPCTHPNSPSVFFLSKWASVICVILQLACFPLMFLRHYFVSLLIPKLHSYCLHSAIPSMDTLQLFTQKVLFISNDIYENKYLESSFFQWQTCSFNQGGFFLLTNTVSSVPQESFTLSGLQSDCFVILVGFIVKLIRDYLEEGERVLFM